jgi:hypothetical protein
MVSLNEIGKLRLLFDFSPKIRYLLKTDRCSIILSEGGNYYDICFKTIADGVMTAGEMD